MKIGINMNAFDELDINRQISMMLELCAPVSDVYRDYTPERYYRRAAEAARKIAARVEEASGKKSR